MTKELPEQLELFDESYIRSSRIIVEWELIQKVKKERICRVCGRGIKLGEECLYLAHVKRERANVCIHCVRAAHQIMSGRVPYTRRNDEA